MSTGEERRSAGIDVGARELVVAVRGAKGGARIRRFGNAATGHRALVEWLVESQVTRVCVEASGIYSLDVCLALHGAEGIDVMVANPRAVKSFGEALLARNKTDPDDATVLLAFAERMPLSPWKPPSANVLTLRTIMRRVHSLSKSLRREKNQLHAAEQTATTPEAVLEDLAEGVRALERRITRLERDAGALVRGDAALRRRLELLVSVRGIAERSALQLLSELAVLSEDMTAKQWVAHAGLDPRKVQSGTSIDKPARISRRGQPLPARGALHACAHPRAPRRPRACLLRRDGGPRKAAHAGHRRRHAQAPERTPRDVPKGRALERCSRLPSVDDRRRAGDDFVFGVARSRLTENRLSIRSASASSKCLRHARPRSDA